MGTSKRERQKAGHRARVDAARQQKRRRDRRRRLVTIGAVLALFGMIAAIVIALSADDGQDVTSADTDGDALPTTLPLTPTTAPPVPATLPVDDCPPVDGSAPQTLEFAAAPNNCLEPGASYTAVMETTEGTVRIDLDTENNPITANNFIFLSRYQYYDETLIHRTEPSIDIIQGGAPHTNSASDPGPGYALLDEGDQYAYTEGEIVMARTPQPNGAGAQFFFTAGPNSANLSYDPALPPEQQPPGAGTYVPFGTVTEGLDVVQAILALHDPETSAPSEPITVTKVTIEQT